MSEEAVGFGGIPDRPPQFGITFGRIATKNAELYPDRIALVDGSRSLTYGHLNSSACRIANALANRGVGRGDSICILADNSIDYMLFFYGAAKIGAAVAALNVRLTGPELASCLEVARPKVAVVAAEYSDLLRLALTSESTIEEVWWFDEQPQPSLDLGVEQRPLASVLEQAASSPVLSEGDVTSQDPLTILFTSGSTGRPKGVAISHGALAARAMLVAAELGLTGEHTYLAWAPMFHVACADYALSTGLLGGRVIVLPRFDARILADYLETERVGWLLLMPGTIDLFLEELRARPRKIRDVHVVGCMADLLPPDDIAALTQGLDAPFLNSFGSTEAAMVPCVSLLPGAVGQRPPTLAKPQSPFCDVRLVDDSGADVSAGQPGEMLLRGPTLFSGYWNDPIATEEAFQGGWFHTGDVMLRNADGTLDFVDRKSYMIKSGGENVYPQEIERALLAHPDVVEATVVRAPSPKWGETPVAFVAPRPGSGLTEEMMFEQCVASGLARYKIPRVMVFMPVDDFPRNVTGKVVRRDLERVAASRVASS